MLLNILVTAASRRVGLVRAFRHALDAMRVRGSVIGTDISPLSPAVHFCDRAYRVPLSSEPGYLDAIAALCDGENVGLVVPTIDEELPLFGGAVARFAAHGVRIAVSPEETSRICNDKYETCVRLRQSGVAAAASYLPGTIPPSPTLPMFVKPRGGRGSIGAFVARTTDELAFFTRYVDDPVIQDYLAGPEFTIDLLCDFEGRPLSVVPRERVVIRAGVIDRGRTVLDPALIDTALECARAFRFHGPVNVQCRVVGGVPTVFEINPRFSGGIPLTIAAGADFPRMVAELTLGRRVDAAIGLFRHDLWMTSYESSLFLGPAHMNRLLPLELARAVDVEAVA
jgi:carbamoyl-phosphate synthase large subunit